MSESHGIEMVLLRFPRQRALICGLALRNEAFRALCEDYGLARAALSRFEADPKRRELAEYRTLVADLELEIVAAIATPDGEPSGDMPPGPVR